MQLSKPRLSHNVYYDISDLRFLYRYPEGVYPLVIGAPDEVVWNASEKEPPVIPDTKAE